MSKVTITIKKEALDRLLSAGADGVLKRIGEEVLADLKEEWRRLQIERAKANAKELSARLVQKHGVWEDVVYVEFDTGSLRESVREDRLNPFLGLYTYDLDVDFDDVFDDDSLSTP